MEVWEQGGEGVKGRLGWAQLFAVSRDVQAEIRASVAIKGLGLGAAGAVVAQGELCVLQGGQEHRQEYF